MEGWQRSVVICGDVNLCLAGERLDEKVFGLRGANFGDECGNYSWNATLDWFMHGKHCRGSLEGYTLPRTFLPFIITV